MLIRSVLRVAESTFHNLMQRILSRQWGRFTKGVDCVHFARDCILKFANVMNIHFANQTNNKKAGILLMLDWMIEVIIVLPHLLSQVEIPGIPGKINRHLLYFCVKILLYEQIMELGR